MNRRKFLVSSSAVSAGLITTGRLFAAPPSSPKMLLVFLRGGYDCASALVPYSSSFYYESRPNIAIAKASANSDQETLALDDTWALAPALRPSLAPWYSAKQIAFIPFAGTDDLSRSHFETQDGIERGQGPNDRDRLESGFLARLFAVLQGGNPIAFTDSLPLVFRGAGDVPNLSVRSLAKPAFDQRQASILAAMYQSNHLQPAIAEGLQLRQDIAKTFAEEMANASRGAVSAQGFELEAKRIGKLMRDQYGLGFVDVGSWDTHINQGAAQGALATNLQNLARGLNAFAAELGSEWANTVVVVISEFGRTFRENGDRGTDHGHGTVYWVAGGSIRGGRIVGEQVHIEPATLFQNRDYPVLNNYRSVLGGLFQRLWDLNSSQIERIFPGVTPTELQLI